MKFFHLLIVTLLFSFSTFAQVQIGQDIDGEATFDVSGTSVSLSSDGSIVAIGASENKDNGNGSGHARVYQNQSGKWIQLGKDIDGKAGDGSGVVSLSADGSILAIGAPGNSDNAVGSGHVGIYKYSSGKWTQLGKDIDGKAVGDGSGVVSLSADGSIVAIGSPNSLVNGNSPGHARIYRYSSDTWTQVGKDIDGESVGDGSGASVSLSADGSIVAIGSRKNGSNSGHVRIYKNLSGTWTQVGKDIDGKAVGDGSGVVSLSADGSIVAIGGFGNDGNGSNSGHVRIYKNLSGTWTQVGNDINGEAKDDYSGQYISLSSDGSIVAIGAPGNDANGDKSGHVRIYKNLSGTWTQVGNDINGEAKDDYSGVVSLSAEGSVVAIGAPFNSGNGSSSGHVRVYKMASLGINEIKNEFTIYPNPTSKELIIKIESNLLGSEYSIISPLGQKVKQGKLTGTMSLIDLSRLPKGNYVLRIGESNQSYKFMVQ